MTEQNQGAIGAGGASRRMVLLGAGAVGAAGLLAACGGDQATAPPPHPPARARAHAPAPPPTPPAGDAAPGKAPTTAAEEIKVADIPVGGGKFLQDRHALVTQPT